MKKIWTLAAFVLCWCNVAAAAAAAPAADLSDIKTKMNAAQTGDPELKPGAPLYRQHCAQCHEGQAQKAPTRTFLAMMTPEAIYDALSMGIMRPLAERLDDAQKHHVAEYLSGSPVGLAKAPIAPPCSGDAAGFDRASEPTITGWGQTPDNAHFIGAESAKLALADVPRLKLKWAVAYPNTMRVRSRPTFAYGALYTGSQDGTVYALDAKSGCIRWTFKTSAEVRTPVLVQSTRDAGSAAPLAFFGDLIGRLYAVDALTGREVWRVKADEHPSATITASPVLHGGRLYVPVSSLEEAMADPKYPCCTFRGSMLALDARTGKELWKTYTIAEKPRKVGQSKIGTAIYSPSGAAIWNTPTLDPKRGVLYAGTGNNYTGPANDRSNAVMAFDLESGRIRWSWQVVPGDAWNVGCMIGLDTCPEPAGPDFDIGSGTMLVTLADGTDRIFVGLKSGQALALDPDAPQRGMLWTNRVGRGSIQGGIQFGMTYDGRRLYVPIADMQHSMDQSSAEREKEAGPLRPGLYALDPATGKLLWKNTPDNVCYGREFCDPGILASIVGIPGAVFAGHMDGRIRAYDTERGQVLWSFDTSQPLPTLSGKVGSGGSIGGGGPVVHDGMVYVNSGYGLYFHMPGNVLAAFSVDGK
ncbi:MAG: PQQ-binding-like beta-propeller repeat protein [Steroidobacteraceae bacterium]